MISQKEQNIYILFAIMMAILIMIALTPDSGEAKKVTETLVLHLGDKYLNELEYEKAIASYELAIQIDPKCTEAYLKLADAYVAIGEPATAKKVLT